MGTSIFAILRSTFLTRRVHDALCATVQTRTCAKIDEIKAELETMEEKREQAKRAQHNKDLWLAQTLQRIGDAVGSDVPPMPTDKE